MKHQSKYNPSNAAEQNQAQTQVIQPALYNSRCPREMRAAKCKLQATKGRPNMKGYIISETASYIYTRELCKLEVVSYFIDCGRYLGCTPYATEEEARNNISYEAAAFGHLPSKCTIRREARETIEIKNHRYKKV